MQNKTNAIKQKNVPKIGYSTTRHVYNNTGPEPPITFMSSFSSEELEGRIIGSFSGGYYTPHNTSVPGGAAYYYQSKLAGKKWCEVNGPLNEYLMKTRAFKGISPNWLDTQTLDSLITSGFTIYGLDNSDALYDEQLSGLYGNDYRFHNNFYRPFVDLFSHHDNSAFPYLPPGIPIIPPKLTNFYQERPFSFHTSGYYTGDVGNKLLPVHGYDIGFHVPSNYNNALQDCLYNYFGGRGYSTPNLFTLSGSVRIGTDQTKLVNPREYLKRFCTMATVEAGYSRSSESVFGTPLVSYLAYFCSATSLSFYISPNILSSGYPWPTNKYPFFCTYGTDSLSGNYAFLYYTPSLIPQVPFAGSLPYLNTADTDHPFKYGIVHSDHIDFVAKSLFLADSTTGALTFKNLESDLDVWQFSVNCNLFDPATLTPPVNPTTYPGIQWNGASGASGGTRITAKEPVKHTIVDAKKLVHDWFFPIHEDIPLKSTAVAGDAIPLNFYSNCNRQRINIRLDLLDLDVTDFPDQKISVVITNPGIFVGVNGQPPSYVFCNGTLNAAEAAANIFIDLYFFPHCQFYSDSLSTSVTSSIDTLVLPDSSTDHRAASHFTRKCKSYYESFDRIGSYFKQTKQIDDAFLNMVFPNAGVFFDAWTYAPLFDAINTHILQHPTSNFLDYFDSSFDFFIVAGHLDPDDIPDVNDVNNPALPNVLYSTKTIPDDKIVLVSADSLNSYVKPFTYSTIYGEYDQSDEGTLFTYTNSLYTRPKFFLTKNITIDKFDYVNSKRPFNDKLNPFFNLMMCETNMEPQPNAILQAPRDPNSGYPFEGSGDIIYIEYPKTERYPFQLSFLPIPVGPIVEPPSYQDEVDYIKEFGSFYEFKCFFTGSGIYAPGTLDSFYIGAYATNRSKKIKCYIESVDDPAINSIILPETVGQFLSEIDLVATNSFSTEYQRNCQFYKYPGTQTGNVWMQIGGFGPKQQSPFPHYSIESGPALLLQPAPFTLPSDLPFGDIYYFAVGSPYPPYRSFRPDHYSPTDSQNKVIDQVADIRFFVLTFRVYVAPVPGHPIIPTPTDPHLPGYLDAGSLKADGLLDFKLEFCAPLFDQADSTYKYLSVESSPDKTRYDSVFRIYTHLFFPKYYKK